MNVEKRDRQDLDVDIISHLTIEALLKYLGIEPEDNQYALDNKLNQHRIEIQGQKPTTIKKKTHQPNKMGTIGGAGADTAKEEEGDLEREEEGKEEEEA
jgi:hypothetical protein